MSELALLNDVGSLTAGKYADDKIFDTVAKRSVFLPRIQLYGSNSNVVKRGKFPIGHYGLVRSKDNIHDLGSEFDCIPLAWRPKALRIDGDDTKAWYNPESVAFKDVVEESKVANSGNMFGPEFLVYIPGGDFATFFFGNPTFRRSAPLLKALLQKAATVGSELIERKKYTWHGPTVSQCSSPLNLPEPGSEESLALVARMRDEAQRFNTPPEEEAEPIETDERAR